MTEYISLFLELVLLISVFFLVYETKYALMTHRLNSQLNKEIESYRKSIDINQPVLPHVRQPVILEWDPNDIFVVKNTADGLKYKVLNITPADLVYYTRTDGPSEGVVQTMMLDAFIYVFRNLSLDTRNSKNTDSYYDYLNELRTEADLPDPGAEFDKYQKIFATELVDPKIFEDWDIESNGSYYKESIV